VDQIEISLSYEYGTKLCFLLALLKKREDLLSPLGERRVSIDHNANGRQIRIKALKQDVEEFIAKVEKEFTKDGIIQSTAGTFLEDMRNCLHDAVARR